MLAYNATKHDLHIAIRGGLLSPRSKWRELGDPPAKAQVAGRTPTHQGTAPRHVSAEAFLQATTVALGHLESKAQKAIRATCRAGRLQHDRLLTHMRLTLGRETHLEGSPGGAASQGPSTPQQLLESLHAAVGRGARPQSLAVCFRDHADGRREAQL